MKHSLYILSLVFFVFGCNNDDDKSGGEGEENPDEIIENITGVQLYFPQEDMLCNEGTNLTPTESTVFFEWEASSYAENYTITVENLSTGSIIQRETTEDIIPIVIERATPYSWYVEYSFGNEIEKSDVWQFYNAGPGVESHVPFPATIISPNMAQSIAATSTVTLEWTGADVDNDIVGYDVYFGTESIPENAYTSNITDTTLSVPVTSGTIYYWKVVTKDEFGHASDSGIFQFRVL